MKLLHEYIVEQGEVIDESILKVDSFLNHQVDPILMDKIGNEFYEYFKKYPITKVVTVETSGISPALFCALKFNVPMVFIKKNVPSTMKNMTSALVYSFTKQKEYTISLSNEYIDQNDHILFIDDFLANGQAFLGVEKIIYEIGAKIDGVGIVIEKSFQNGREVILSKGYDLYSLARIASFKNNTVHFIKEKYKI